MIVRISGTGQFELDDVCVRKLDALDTELTEALHAQDEPRFHKLLCDTVELVQKEGKPVPADSLASSEVIIPPEDITMEEAASFFTDEGLMAPLPA